MNKFNNYGSWLSFLGFEPMPIKVLENTTGLTFDAFLVNTKDRHPVTFELLDYE